jgi:hypothetical protein
MFEITPVNAWKVGDPRINRQGKSMKGLRKESYWTARLDNGKNNVINLDESIISILANFKLHKSFFNRLIKGGGEAQLFIGLFGESFNFMPELKAHTIFDLGKLGIDVQFDIYNESAS